MPELESLVLQRAQLQQRVQRARLRNLEALQCHGVNGRGHTHARVAEAEEDAAGAERVRHGLGVGERDCKKQREYAEREETSSKWGMTKLSLRDTCSA